MPTPDNLTRLIVQVSKYRFIMQPAIAINAMKSGISKIHSPFWESIALGELCETYKALHTSASKVLQMLKEPVFCNQSQERVYLFLRDFIGDVKPAEVRSFLHFVTGSAVYLAKSILVTFNNLTSLGPRPVSHTYSWTIEQLVSYKNETWIHLRISSSHERKRQHMCLDDGCYLKAKDKMNKILLAK